MLVTSGLAHLPPIKVVTILSGVIGVNIWLFILSAIIARGARFLFLAWLLRRYGEPIRHFIEERLGLIAAVGRGRPHFALLARQIPALSDCRQHGRPPGSDSMTSTAAPTSSLQRNTAIFLTFAMAAVVGAALGFEHIGHYIPCKLCLEQRVPYYIGVPVMALAAISATLRWPPLVTRGCFSPAAC